MLAKFSRMKKEGVFSFTSYATLILLMFSLFGIAAIVFLLPAYIFLMWFIGNLVLIIISKRIKDTKYKVYVEVFTMLWCALLCGFASVYYIMSL